MSARYEVGELVNVTIRGAQVTAADKRDVVVQYGTELGVHEMAVAIDSPDVTVRRAVPADGVPQQGDIWVDQFGAKYFVRAGVQDNVVLVPSDSRSLSQVHWETLHAGAEGPIKLLWREGWSPQPAAPADLLHRGKCEDQADEPARHSDHVGVLRSIADGIESGMTVPASVNLIGSVASLQFKSNEQAAVDAWAARFGLATRLSSHVYHEADRRWSEYSTSVGPDGCVRIWCAVDLPDEPAIDGSPSDLDGPPAAPTKNGLCPYGGVRGDEHEYTEGCCENDCANEWHFGVDRPRFGGCPACGEPAPSTPDGGGS